MGIQAWSVRGARWSVRTAWWAPLVLTLALVLAPRSALAATIPVACGDVPGLKAAITSAAPGDRINLTAGCTYTLTTVDNIGTFGPNGLPGIFSQLTIEGNGATITRSGPQFRLLRVAPSGNLTINRLTLSNGSLNNPTQGGGAVLVEGGVLTLANSTVSANTSSNGGAIQNVGTLIIRTTTFLGNSSPNAGGAIFNGVPGSLAVTDSTFAGNSSGGIGGAIFNSTGGATVGSSTLSGNTATLGGGAIYNVGAGSITVQNSIVANNAGGNCKSTALPVIDGGHNISWPDNTCTGLNADPQLMPLTGNGGPNQTFALPSGSPAIDAVPATGAGCLPADQRGVPRPQGPGCDIGAFELAVIPAPTPAPPPTPASPPTSAPVPSPPSTGRGLASDDGWFRLGGLAVTLGGLILVAVAVQVWRRQRSTSLGC